VVPVALAVLGALIGSFLNVVIYRMPRGLSVVMPPSTCPVCGIRISPRDNVPVLSYLVLRGRCRACGVRISPRYLVVEVLGSAIPVLLYLRFGLGREFLVYWPLSCSLLVIAFIDLDLKIIPDRITLPGIVLGLVLAPLLGLSTIAGSLLGAAIGGGALYVIGLLGTLAFKKESMGGGDVKLAAMLGAFLGWQSVILLLFVAFFLGAVAGAAALGIRGRDWDHRIPFGPFITVAALVAILWGQSVIGWYLSVL
jgi:leader peptidase (prepilin peptidase)/N-methyltransferase